MKLVGDRTFEPSRKAGHLQHISFLILFLSPKMMGKRKTKPDQKKKNNGNLYQVI